MGPSRDAAAPAAAALSPAPAVCRRRFVVFRPFSACHPGIAATTFFSTPNTAKLFRAGAYTEHLSPAKRDPQERESFSSCIGTMAENNIVAKNVCSPAVKPLGFVGVAGDN